MSQDQKQDPFEVAIVTAIKATSENPNKSIADMECAFAEKLAAAVRDEIKLVCTDILTDLLAGAVAVPQDGGGAILLTLNQNLQNLK